MDGWIHPCEMKEVKQQFEVILPDAGRDFSCNLMLTKPLQLAFAVYFHFLVCSLDRGFRSRCLSCRLDFPLLPSKQASEAQQIAASCLHPSLFNRQLAEQRVRGHAAVQVPLRGAGGGCSCLPRGYRSTDMRQWRRESRPCGSARAASISNSAPPRGAFRNAAVETAPGRTPVWPAPPGSWGRVQTQEMMKHQIFRS